MPRLTRRALLQAAPAMGLATLAGPALAQGTAPQVLVIGGGFGGASAARHLKQLEARLKVTLVVADAAFIACPNSNAVIAGLAPMEAQRFSYAGLHKVGIDVIEARAEAVDGARRQVRLSTGTTLTYDRLVLAPGIDIDWKALPGYSETAAEQMPHAWKAGAQTELMRRQLQAMKAGGTAIISMPASPIRCPPAVYERASLFAHYFKAKNPRAKVLILDARDQMPRQKQVEAAWKRLYGSMIERIALSDGGNVSEIEPASRTFVTDFGRHDADLASVIPPQRAGAIAAAANVADRTGWCPVKAATFESELVPGIHIIGDAIIGASLPKSASAAADEGRAVAATIVALLAGREPPRPRIASQCFSLLSPDEAVVIESTSEPVAGQFADIDPDHANVQPPPVPGRRAEDWFKAIGREVFGA